MGRGLGVAHQEKGGLFRCAAPQPMSQGVLPPALQARVGAVPVALESDGDALEVIGLGVAELLAITCVTGLSPLNR